MKKDYITLVDVGDPDRELTALEVFYLKEPTKPKAFRIVDDAGCDVETGKYMGGSLPLLDDKATWWQDQLGECFSSGWDDPLAGNELDINENSAGGGAHAGYVCNDEGEVTQIKGCCPVGPEGESGPRGIDEERMYPLILDSLKKFSECKLDLSKDSACEVLADGITKKIIKYMWPQGE